MASTAPPSLLECLEGTTVDPIQAYREMGLRSGAGAVLLAQSDRGLLAVEDVEAMGRSCERAGAV